MGILRNPGLMTTSLPRLVLASRSPARRRLLRDAGFAPVVDASGVDESLDATTGTAAAVCTLAERKASAVAGRHRGDLVLGCDSLLDLDGTPLGKPASPRAAAALWRRMSGRQGTLHTGHCLTGTRSGQRTIAASSTLVRLGAPTEQEIADYVATGEPGQMAPQSGTWPAATGRGWWRSSPLPGPAGRHLSGVHDVAQLPGLEVRKIKPWLPAESGGGIAFRHAIELEYPAPGTP